MKKGQTSTPYILSSHFEDSSQPLLGIECANLLSFIEEFEFLLFIGVSSHLLKLNSHLEMTYIDLSKLNLNLGSYILQTQIKIHNTTNDKSIDIN